MVTCKSFSTTGDTISSQKPNVIFILADDLGYGDLGVYGQDIIDTPFIDRMAKEGMKFTAHYAGSTVCAPSRSALLTGTHTGHTSVRANDRSQPLLLEDEDVTVADIFKKAGYRTGLVGKWGVGHPPPHNDPARNGFDYFFGYLNMWHAHNFYPEFLYKNGSKVWLDNRLRRPQGTNPWAHMPEGTGVAEQTVQFAPDLIEQESLSFIERNSERPFFLFISLNLPHANNENTENGLRASDYGPFAEKDWPEQEKGFARFVTDIDHTVGKVLQKLESLGLDRQTLVIFTSDNGPHAEGGHDPDFFDSNGAMRGIKRDLYEGGIRVPMIVRWPGKVPAGTTSDHISAFWDVLPTVSDLTGIPAPEGIDGISFLPTLLGHPGDQQQHKYLYWEFYEDGGEQAVRQGKWKAVRRQVRSRSPLQVELYDLSRDPSEQHDIADEHPEKARELLRLMQQAHKSYEPIPLNSVDKE
ncbi:arylsulfatase [Halalkalibaculum sp. DA3122]|uniref:arylsulfatase n=1 Tax=Halalkalibaculum sp. DA3122 TaxID=3373607 RepID=UPI003754543E